MVSHFNISSNKIREEQLLNIPLISSTLAVLQSDISGNILNKEKFVNIFLIFCTLFVSHQSPIPIFIHLKY